MLHLPHDLKKKKTPALSSASCLASGRGHLVSGSDYGGETRKKSRGSLFIIDIYFIQIEDSRRTVEIPSERSVVFKQVSGDSSNNAGH